MRTDRPPNLHLQTPISFNIQLNNSLTSQLRPVLVFSLSSCAILTMETGDSPRFCYLYSTRHGVVSKKTGVISTTMETSDPVQQNVLLYEDSFLLLKTLWSRLVG